MATDYAKQAADYKKINDDLKEHFRDKRNNEQSLSTERVKYFNPITTVMKEEGAKTTKEIVDTLTKNQENISNLIVPYAQNLEKRMDRVETFESLPFFNTNLPIENVPQSTPKKELIIKEANLDIDLDETDKENLSLMDLQLPSDVFKNGTYQTVIKKITSENIKIGKILSDKDKKGQKSSLAEREIAASKKETLIKYKDKINLIKQAYVSKVFGEGLKMNLLDNDKLVEMFSDAISSIEKGYEGFHNIALGMLNELLNRKIINKDDFDNVTKHYFSKRLRGRPKK